MRARRPSPRRAAALAVLTVAATFWSVTPSAVAEEPAAAAPSAGPTSVSAARLADGDLVRRSGTRLVSNAGDFRFVGFQLNLGGSYERYYCHAYTDAEVGPELDSIRALGGNVVRVWFLQSYGGPGYWERFDLVLREARERGMRVLPTLTNHWGACEQPGDATAVSKPLSWYQDGYRSDDLGWPMTYREYVRAVAERYRDDPTVLAWQLVNEAETFTSDRSCDEQAGRLALRAFSDDMVQVIRGTGSRHLVNLGTMGGGQCGTAGSEGFRYVHGGLLDLCEYHDYSYEVMPGDEWNGLEQRLRDCAALGKPLFVGEMGLQAGVQADGSTGAVTPATLDRRASVLGAKMTAQAAAGAVGHLVWQRGKRDGDGYTMAPGDPVDDTIRRQAAALGLTGPQRPDPVVSPTASAVVPGPAAAPAVTAPLRAGWQSRLPLPSLRRVHAVGPGTRRVRLVLQVRSGTSTAVAVRGADGTVLWSRRATGPLDVTLALPADARTVALRGAAPVGYRLTLSGLR